MIQELDTVVLAHNIAKHNLWQGDIGSVVHCYEDGRAFEVEFIIAAGETVALLTLTAHDIRPVGNREILHVREYGTIPPVSSPM